MHEYIRRPTAKKIEEVFKQSNILKLMNSYEVQCKVVTAALVTITLSDAEIKETIWIATAGKDGPYDLTTYIFIDHEFSSSSHNKQAHPKLCASVSDMYHMYVLLLLQLLLIINFCEYLI